MKNVSPAVHFGSTHENDPEQAVKDLGAQLQGPDQTAVFFFCSPSNNLTALAKALNSYFNCPVIGCTSAGGFVPGVGYTKDSLSAVALQSNRIKVANYLIPNLDHFSILQGKELQRRICSDFNLKKINAKKMFAFLLIDGLSCAEERIIQSLTAFLHPLQIVGGSAGDNLNFLQAHVYQKGTFFSNAASLAVFETNLPFSLFNTQHFEATDKKLVITEACPISRKVTEINGYPAVPEYARLIGCDTSLLTAADFAKNPPMVKIDGHYHVRSIQQANLDGSLTFSAAIDTGLVMALGQGKNLIQQTRNGLERVQQKIGPLRFILGCDGFHRRIESESCGVEKQLQSILEANNLFGFSSFGEQYQGAHVNQTLTGIALGE